jgi:cytochrome P450
VAIPKGAMVLPLIAAANRDPAVFPDPDRFDIERNTQGHLGFGLGNHFCLGASLARLEARVALQTIFERLPKWRIETADVTRHGSWLIRGPTTLPLTF